MRKIIDFIMGQALLIFCFFCVGVLFVILWDFSYDSSKPIVINDEIVIEDNILVIDINTGSIEKNGYLNIELESLISKKTYFKIDTIWEILLLISIILAIISDIILWTLCIFKRIIMIPRNLKYKKILKDKCDISDERLYELPMYETILANAIYKKRYQYEMVVARLEYYYKINGILGKNNKLKEEKEFDINSLPELERLIMKQYQRKSEETKKLTQQEVEEENQKNRTEFKNKVDEILKEKGYYEEDKIKIKVNKFFEAIRNLKGNKEEFLKSDEVFRNFLIFFAFGIVISISKIAMWLAIILGIWGLIKVTGISLTAEGELERAKIMFLISHLKKKKILSEEEKYFLTMLTKI